MFGWFFTCLEHQARSIAAMGTQSAQWVAASRLVRRTGFGATGSAVDAAVKLGPARYVSSVLAADPLRDAGAKAIATPIFSPLPRRPIGASKAELRMRNQQISGQLHELTAWWLRRMVAVEVPFAEKLTFCWHNHFATAATKVREANWLLTQNFTLRRSGRGDFRTLALAMLTDAALLAWLDGERNTAKAPNENLSREFMELFALGHGRAYTELDVREGARALTGWTIAPDGATQVRASRRDNTSKTLLGVTGDLDVTGFCDAVLAQPASASYLASRWWGQLASDTAPKPSTLNALVSAYGKQRDLSALFAEILTTPAFGGAEGSLVIDPVEWLVGAVRALRVPVPDDGAALKLVGVLRALGQVPFYPPNVGGWPAGQAWLSSAAADARMQAASSLSKAADLSVLSTSAKSDRVDAVGYLLGVGAWSARSARVLGAEVSDPLRLVTVALNTPEYLIH